ncbi:hypothetical protein TNCV_2094691 [Trichonephila clavipes]|nr:hypothetical protein TNCV_2094691 [Trichonephila clavipes]
MERRGLRVVKIEAELILKPIVFQLMKQDLEKAKKCLLEQFHFLKKSKTLLGATAAAHGNQMARMITKRKMVSKNDSVKGLPRLTDNGKTHCIPCKLAKSKRISFKKDGGHKVNSNLGYNLNLPDYYDDEDDSDRVKDSLTSRLVSKTSTETPSTSEKPDVSSDNHSLIQCTEVKWIRNIG